MTKLRTILGLCAAVWTFCTASAALAENAVVLPSIRVGLVETNSISVSAVLTATARVNATARLSVDRTTGGNVLKSRQERTAALSLDAEEIVSTLEFNIDGDSKVDVTLDALIDGKIVSSATLRIGESIEQK